MPNKHIQTADGIRGLALLIVVVLHATGLFFPSLHGALGGTAQPGVWLFFILSSFLLTCKFIRSGFSFHGVTSYILGRTLRIIPLFIMSVGIYYLCGMFDYDKFISIITFQDTYIHLWTIPVEFSFYFILPVIAFASIKIKKAFGSTYSLIFLLLLVACSSCLFPYTDLSYNGMMVWYLPVFLYGMILAFAYASYEIKVTWWVSDAVCLIIILALLLMAPVPFSYITGADKNGWFTNKFVILGPLLTTFIYLQICGGGFINTLLKTPLMEKLGKFSFSIYLLHILIIFKVYPYHKNDISMYFLTIVLCFGIGVIGYYVIESPMERLRHKLMGFFKNKEREYHSSSATAVK